MSGDTSDPRSKLPPEGEMLLPRSVRSALLRELSPTQADRDRVHAAVAAMATGVAASTIVSQAEAAMAARAAVQLKAGAAVAAKALATKLIVSSAVIASVAGAVTTGVLMHGSQRSSAPAAAPAHSLRENAANHSTPDARSASQQITEAPQPAVAPQATPSGATESNTTAPHADTPSAANLDAASPTGIARVEGQQVATDRPAAIAPFPKAAPSRSRRMREHMPRTASNPPVGAQSSAAEAAPASAPVTPAADKVEKTAPEAASPAPAKPIPAQRPSTLADELALVRGASDAIDRRDAAGALSLLARYDQQHPNGTLATEAHALRVIALCSAKRPEASGARDAFLRLHATSALAERVRSACK